MDLILNQTINTNSLKVLSYSFLKLIKLFFSLLSVLGLGSSSQVSAAIFIQFPKFIQPDRRVEQLTSDAPYRKEVDLFRQVDSQYYLLPYASLNTYLINSCYNLKMEEAEKFKPKLFIKLFIGYIYFMQGVYLSLVGMIIYIYPTFPSPDVLSAFSFVTLPFSFKYVTAPIVQKFSITKYGRRKFWIVLGLFGTSILTYPLAFIAQKQEQYLTTIFILTLILLLISMGDVAIDAASVIELQDPVLAGYLQAGMQPLGILLGSFLITKISNPTFWSIIWIDGPLCTVQTYFIAISLIGFIVATFIHFFYHEHRIDQNKEDQLPKVKEILRYYLHFVKPKYTLCRHVIFFIIANQGLKFFMVNFNPEAITRGFSKNQSANIENICMGVSIVVNTIFSRFLSKENIYKFLLYLYIVQLILSTGIYLLDSFEYQTVFFTLFFISLISYMRFLLIGTIINGFGNSSLPGLCLTTLASFSNFGNNTYIQLKAYNLFGYYWAVGGGLVIAWIFAIFMKKIIEWMRQGEHQGIAQQLKND